MIHAQIKNDEEKMVDLIESLLAPATNNLVSIENFSQLFKLSKEVIIPEDFQPLIIHTLMDECLSVYYHPKSLEQLESLVKFIKVFCGLFVTLKKSNLSLLKRILIIDVEFFPPFIFFRCFTYHYALRDVVVFLINSMILFPLFHNEEEPIQQE